MWICDVKNNKQLIIWGFVSEQPPSISPYTKVVLPCTKYFFYIKLDADSITLVEKKEECMMMWFEVYVLLMTDRLMDGQADGRTSKR
jgi:hypothetical protein